MKKPKKKATGIRCPTCGRPGMPRVYRSVTIKVGGVERVVPRVAVEECAHCGERLYDLAALDKIRRAKEVARRARAA